MTEERERFYSRLATLPGVQPMPSIGAWVLVRVDEPAELARRHAPAVYPDAALLAERLELMRRNVTGPYR